VDSGTELGLSGYLGLRQHHRPTLGNARHAEGRHKTLPPTGRVFSVGKPTALRVQNISGPRASVSTAPSSNVYGRHPIPSEAAPAFCGLGAGRHGYSASPSCPHAARANNEGDSMKPISRRDLLVSTAAMSAASGAAVAQSAIQRPNIVFIVADDMGGAAVLSRSGSA